MVHSHAPNLRLYLVTDGEQRRQMSLHIRLACLEGKHTKWLRQPLGAGVQNDAKGKHPLGAHPQMGQSRVLRQMCRAVQNHHVPCLGPG